MKIKQSNIYNKDISKIKDGIFSQVTKSLQLLVENPEHPSLHNKNIKCKRADNLFSIRVNKQYRILNHDKYDRLTKDC